MVPVLLLVGIVRVHFLYLNPIICKYQIFSTDILSPVETLAARGLEELFFRCLVEPKLSSRHRNRYFEGMDNGQKTPHGHPDFKSYIKILCVFIDNR